jgi:hypothetical protein
MDLFLEDRALSLLIVGDNQPDQSVWFEYYPRGQRLTRDRCPCTISRCPACSLPYQATLAPPQRLLISHRPLRRSGKLTFTALVEYSHDLRVSDETVLGLMGLTLALVGAELANPRAARRELTIGRAIRSDWLNILLLSGLYESMWIV